MTRISQNVVTKPLGRGQPVALTIEHVLMGALMTVVFFGSLAIFRSPTAPLMGKMFILSIAVAAIAAIALLAKNVGALSEQQNERNS